MLLLFLITFNQCYSQDALLQAIYGNRYNPEQYQKEYEEETEVSNSEIPNDSEEAEHLSWKLGRPDNLPELEIYYEPVCEVVCR